MWNLSLRTAEVLLEMAEDRLVTIAAAAANGAERNRLARAVAELRMLRDEALPVRHRIVLGCPEPTLAAVHG